MALSYPQPAPGQLVAWLGQLTPAQFMARHWQKKPLLVRSAFAGFKPAISIDEVRRLGQDPQASSRLVRFNRSKNRWSLEHGPFTKDQIPNAAAADWTLLVQQVNSLLPAADRFLDAFRFIPEARLDDLMISIAGPKGGVGPHVDSYDVFLIQASGKRRWQIAQTKNPALRADAPLKILAHFKPEHDWLLEPGDLLYLPPGFAHQGDAVGKDCMTWSVGFRAPVRASLADLVWADHLESLKDRMWKDPWLGATRHPGMIPPRLLQDLTREFLDGLPKPAAVSQSIARALSEPADSVVFEPPARPESQANFVKKSCRMGLRLHRASRLLYSKGRFFANGEPLPATATPGAKKILKKLADTRQLGPQQCVVMDGEHEPWAVLYDMYRAGWIVYDLS